MTNCRLSRGIATTNDPCLSLRGRAVWYGLAPGLRDRLRTRDRMPLSRSIFIAASCDSIGWISNFLWIRSRDAPYAFTSSRRNNELRFSPTDMMMSSRVLPLILVPVDIRIKVHFRGFFLRFTDIPSTVKATPLFYSKGGLVVKMGEGVLSRVLHQYAPCVGNGCTTITSNQPNRCAFVRPQTECLVFRHCVPQPKPRAIGSL